MAAPSAAPRHAVPARHGLLPGPHALSRRAPPDRPSLSPPRRARARARGQLRGVLRGRGAGARGVGVRRGVRGRGRRGHAQHRGVPARRRGAGREGRRWGRGQARRAPREVAHGQLQPHQPLHPLPAPRRGHPRLPGSRRVASHYPFAVLRARERAVRTTPHQPHSRRGLKRCCYYRNGTIDGQGHMWWELWRNRTLNHTRGHLIELVNSTNVLISSVTLSNSPFWTVHPVYCSNVVMKDLTILAPLDAPNTDGIDPDSSSEVCIEDCYIESGDDLVAVKSGWDQYGISFGKPSTNIVIQRVSGTTPTCSGVGFGSEMSGGISNVLVRDLHVWNSAQAVRLKTDVGRGGYITNITIASVAMEKVKVPIRFSRGADDHPDDRYDPAALPRISNVLVSDVVGVHLQRAPMLEAVPGAVYEGICFRNFSFRGIRRQQDSRWHCESVYGEAHDVFPAPCEEFRRDGSSSWCGLL
uniref:Pectin lyase-like superfamily protein n=1 Tax=Zea mays TaxID=4577 RepID=A0A804PQI3_MAIZE